MCIHAFSNEFESLTEALMFDLPRRATCGLALDAAASIP